MLLEAETSYSTPKGLLSTTPRTEEVGLEVLVRAVILLLGPPLRQLKITERGFLTRTPFNYANK